MTRLIQIAAELQRFLDMKQWPNCVIGGIAVQRWGESRPFEINAVGRASDFEFASGERVRTCSAEDLLVMKALAGREQDWLDIKGVLARQGDKLEWTSVVSELRPLCELKEAPDIVVRLEQERKRLHRN